jgi:hypothetical protein
LDRRQTGGGQEVKSAESVEAQHMCRPAIELTLTIKDKRKKVKPISHYAYQDIHFSCRP